MLLRKRHKITILKIESSVDIQKKYYIYLHIHIYIYIGPISTGVCKNSTMLIQITTEKYIKILYIYEFEI